VKDLFNDWGFTVFIFIVILGLGTLPIIQGISYSAKELKYQQELIDLYHLNGQLTTDSAIKELQLEQADEVLELQHNLLRDMHNRLKKWESLPPWPGEGKESRPNRSEA